MRTKSRRGSGRKTRTTSTEVMIAYAVLALEEFRDELERERYVRRDSDEFIAGNACADLDELEARIDRVERQLPTRAVDEPISRDAVEIAESLSAFDQDRATLATAIELELPVAFIYTNGDLETLRRVVSPYELKTVSDGRRFLVGWDHGREGIRQFEIGKAESKVVATDDVAYRIPEAS
jgi:hypothetical protein